MNGSLLSARADPVLRHNAWRHRAGGGTIRDLFIKPYMACVLISRRCLSCVCHQVHWNELGSTTQQCLNLTLRVGAEKGTRLELGCFTATTELECLPVGLGALFQSFDCRVLFVGRAFFGSSVALIKYPVCGQRDVEKMHCYKSVFINV